MLDSRLLTPILCSFHPCEVLLSDVQLCVKPLAIMLSFLLITVFSYSSVPPVQIRDEPKRGHSIRPHVGLLTSMRQFGASNLLQANIGEKGSSHGYM